MSTETRFRQAVEEFVQEVPHRPDLAGVAVRRAARRRKVTRATVAGAAAAAVALGVPMGTNVIPRLASEVGLAPAESVKYGELVIDLDTLPKGAAPQVPWYSDGVLHYEDKTVPFDSDISAVKMLERVEGGFVVLSSSYNAKNNKSHQGHRLVLVSDDGKITPLAEGWVTNAAVSEDGSRVAWVTGDFEASGQPESAVLGVADTSTGKVLVEEPTGYGPDTNTVGLLGLYRVVLNVADNTPDGVVVWDIRDNTSTPLDGFNHGWSIAPTGELGAFSNSEVSADEGNCVRIVDMANNGQHWETCDANVGKFSADGRSLIVDRAADGADPEDTRILQIVDARTGEPLLSVETKARFDPPHAWEPDGDLIFEAWDSNNRMALVRCTPSKECELATEPRKSDVSREGTRLHEPGARLPYVLPTQ